MAKQWIASRWCCFHVDLVALAVQAASWQVEVLSAPELDAGFRLLYDLKPEEARAQFAAWQASHPEDPLASAAEAASYLFEKCYRQGVLTSEFFLDDKRFLGKIAIKPDQKLRDAFFAEDLRAQNLGRLQLETNPDDLNALFAVTLSLGMEADYAGLIEKHQLASLRMIREADKFAKKLLAAAPDAAAAYLTLGAANYIIGSLPLLKRFFLHFIRNQRRQAPRHRATRNRRRAGPLLVAVRENSPCDGGVAREEDCSGTYATQGTGRGVSAGSALCRGTGQAGYFS